jgi:hypothetical protein
VEFHCRTCYAIFTFTEQLPGWCPQCKGDAFWQAIVSSADPTRPYVLTAYDRLFLKLNRIEAD